MSISVWTSGANGIGNIGRASFFSNSWMISWSWPVLQVLVFVLIKVNTNIKVIKLYSCSTHLSTKCIMLIHVKMPTIVGIFIFMSMINTLSERLKVRNFFICLYFSFYEQLKFRVKLSWTWKKFYNLEARLIW